MEGPPSAQPDIDRILERMLAVRRTLAPAGPPVDRRWVRDYVAGRLHPVAAETVEQMVASSRDWYDALWAAMAEESGLVLRLPPRPDRRLIRFLRGWMPMAALLVIIACLSWMLSLPRPVAPGRDNRVLAWNDHGVKVWSGGVPGVRTNAAAELVEGASQALSTHRIRIPEDVRRLAGKQGVLMGSSADGIPFRLVGPVGTAVATTRPVLRWEKLDKESGYVVVVWGPGLTPNLTSGKSPLPPTTESWKVGPVSLTAGATYGWQVKAQKGDTVVISHRKPAPDAAFRVLSREEMDYLERERANCGGSHLLLAILYAEKLGLLDDAEHELRLFLKLNPGEARRKVVDDLIASLRAPETEGGP